MSCQASGAKASPGTRQSSSAAVMARDADHLVEILAGEEDVELGRIKRATRAEDKAFDVIFLAFGGMAGEIAEFFKAPRPRCSMPSPRQVKLSVLILACGLTGSEAGSLGAITCMARNPKAIVNPPSPSDKCQRSRIKSGAE